MTVRTSLKLFMENLSSLLQLEHESKTCNDRQNYQDFLTCMKLFMTSGLPSHKEKKRRRNMNSWSNIVDIQ